MLWKHIYIGVIEMEKYLAIGNPKGTSLMKFQMFELNYTRQTLKNNGM